MEEAYVWRLQYEAYKLARVWHRLNSDQRMRLVSALLSTGFSLNTLIGQAELLREELIDRERQLREMMREVEEALENARQISTIVHGLLSADHSSIEEGDESQGSEQ